jgi:hypothetical protein
MSKLFRLLFKKYVTEAYKRCYSLGLSVGVDLGKSLASNQFGIDGIESKVQRDIEEIFRSKQF